jgi:hypothetical protein
MFARLLAAAFVGAVTLCTTALLAQTSSRTISAAQLPDTTYTATVDRVQDATHIAVTLQNGLHAVLSAGRPTVNFTSVHPGDRLMFSTHVGQVLVFKDLSVASGPVAPSPSATHLP